MRLIQGGDMRRMHVAAAAAIAMLLTGCGAVTTDATLTTSDALSITDVIDGQDVRIDLPTASTTVGIAVLFHGRGGDVDSHMGSAWLDELRADGWAIVSSDFDMINWGSTRAIDSLDSLTEWAEGIARSEVSLYIGTSMGGLLSLNAMTHGHEVACWYGTMPVVDIRAVAGVPDSATQIADVWPDGVPAEYDPAESIDDMPASTRYRILASPGDTWVPSATNGDVLAAGLAARGVDVTIEHVTGEHADASHYDAADLATFAADCG